MIQEKIIRGDCCSLVSQYRKDHGIFAHYLCVGTTFIHFPREKDAKLAFDIIEENADGTQHFSGCLSWGDKIASAAASKIEE
ncbi:MAG TPA: hypothetical protein VMW92_06005 [Candidatus Heimdallarchaeota archaeon]|nr:hypothetical protein [Candidatus Heimdallarchaeota archaeon]